MTKTKLMAILNVTPDSYFDGGAYFSVEAAVARAKQIETEGADLLDIGGESSRPGSLPISDEEELRRVLPVIQGLKSQIKIPLSIDTSKPIVAMKALEAGVGFLNDISGFEDPQMRELAASTGATICLMHRLGPSYTMQANPSYPRGVIEELLSWFTDRINLLIRSSIRESQIIIDPGIGFGKSVADNLEIIQNLHRFRTLGFPLLLGVSRKHFIGQILNRPPAERLSATLAVNAIAVKNQVGFIRVHDVKEHRDLIEMVERLK